MLTFYIVDWINWSFHFLLGEYSCLTVDLTFKREFSYYLLTIYVPCCMLVIVSWVSFWLDPNAVPARVSLGVTTLLTMSTQTASINNSLPPVAYTKAIDVWTGVRSCYILVHIDSLRCWLIPLLLPNNINIQIIFILWRFVWHLCSVRYLSTHW